MSRVNDWLRVALRRYRRTLNSTHPTRTAYIIPPTRGILSIQKAPLERKRALPADDIGQPGRYAGEDEDQAGCERL